jgi:pimeloyl-ACP methyl ester carboxylesterase
MIGRGYEKDKEIWNWTLFRSRYSRWSGCFWGNGTSRKGISACLWHFKNKNAVMAQFRKLMAQADLFDPLPFDNEELDVQYEIYHCVWQEAEELRESGKLLEQGEKIQCPVVAIHGDYDSSPPEGIEEPLSKILNDFRFILLKNCVHYPWIERTVKDNFYEIIKNELK